MFRHFAFALIALRSLLLPLSIALVAAGCGGGNASGPSPKLQDEAPETEEDHLHGIKATSEIGGLNEQKVDATFQNALGALQECLDSGAARVEFLGGAVSFFLKIDTSGKVDHAHLAKSTLGDRETEKCMLSALRKRKWPKPVGGDHGIARKSFEFDPPNDVRPPTEWAAEEVEKAIEKLGGEIESCKKDARGTFEATAYVSADGTVLAAGVTPPDEDGEEAVDCLVEAIRAASFPSPGSWPAKVTFSL